MSDFLVNLLRRGAGLLSVVAPRRPDLPADLPSPDDPENERQRQADTTINPPAERVTSPGDPVSRGVIFSGEAAARTVRDAAPEVDAERPQVRRASPPATPGRTGPPLEPSIAPSPALARPRRHDDSGLPPPVSESVVPPRGVTPGPRMRVTGRRDAAASFATRVESSEPPRPDPAGASSMGSAARFDDTGPAARVPAAMTSSLRPASIATPREAIQGVETERDPVEPGIEVRIGRIEIRSTPAPPAPTRAPRRPPRGFEAHASARRALDRRWY